MLRVINVQNTGPSKKDCKRKNENKRSQHLLDNEEQYEITDFIY